MTSTVRPTPQPTTAAARPRRPPCERSCRRPTATPRSSGPRTSAPPRPPRRRGAGPGARGGSRPRHLAPDDRDAVRRPPGHGTAPAQAARPRPRPGRHRRRGRRRGDQVRPRRRGLRHRHRDVRRVRRRQGGQAGRQARPAHARAGGDGAGLRHHGPAGGHRPRRVQAGQRVLVTGASGGVGSYAVQIAVAAGAEVTGVASAAKADLVRSLGAAHVLDYATRRLRRGPGPLRRDHRHRRQRLAVPAAPGADADRHRGARRRRGRRPAHRHGPPAPRPGRVPVRAAAAHDAGAQGERRRPRAAHRADRGRSGHAERGRDVPPRRRRRRRCGTWSPGRSGARSPSPCV